MKQLETERVLLRDWQDGDDTQLYNNCRGPKVGPMAGWKPHESLQESQEVLKMFITAGETWATVLKDSGRLIGSVGLHADCMRQGMTDTYMLGYVLAEEYWGRGLMYEMCREVLRYAFEEKNAARISVRHFPFNAQSKRVIQKCGFVYEGTLREAIMRSYDGKVFDAACYSMTRREFMANRRVNHSGEIQREQKYAVVRMSKMSATAFLEWRYEPPFDRYSCPKDAFEEKMQEILSPRDGQEYFAVYDALGHLFGVYEYVFNADNQLQIEFRMCPAMTGKGYGQSFVTECIHFGRQQYHYGGPIVLKTALDNKAALELVSGMGFCEAYRSEELCYGSLVEYVHMKLTAE